MSAPETRWDGAFAFPVAHLPARWKRLSERAAVWFDCPAVEPEQRDLLRAIAAGGDPAALAAVLLAKPY